MTWQKKDREQDDELRREVLKRDGHTCRMCNKKKKGLEIHHIKKWSKAVYLRFDPTNCISLCKQCHYSIRNKEEHYERFFYGILADDSKKKRK